MVRGAGKICQRGQMQEGLSLFQNSSRESVKGEMLQKYFEKSILHCGSLPHASRSSHTSARRNIIKSGGRNIIKSERRNITKSERRNILRNPSQIVAGAAAPCKPLATHIWRVVVSKTASPLSNSNQCRTLE